MGRLHMEMRRREEYEYHSDSTIHTAVIQWWETAYKIEI
jgi:hypothetical protein